MNYDFLVTFTHIASQLFYKWFPLPYIQDMGNVINDEGPNFPKISLNMWSEISQEIISGNRNKLGWVILYKKRFQDNGKILASTCYQHLQHLYDAGGKFILFTDAKYPTLLKMIQDPPLGLSVLGRSELFNQNSVSIIGSRKASPFALNESYKLEHSLAKKDLVIVSGGALGCDIAAHEGILADGKPLVGAIVVFANGLKSLYPQQNARVFDQLRSRGSLFISERLWSQPARPFDFPTRNRIISGLSETLIVMQAAIKSGAMITAQKALDQGREVYVVLSSSKDIREEGNWALFDQGAIGFKSAEGYVNSVFFKLGVSIDDYCLAADT